MKKTRMILLIISALVSVLSSQANAYYATDTLIGYTNTLPNSSAETEYNWLRSLVQIQQPDVYATLPTYSSTFVGQSGEDPFPGGTPPYVLNINDTWAIFKLDGWWVAYWEGRDDGNSQLSVPLASDPSNVITNIFGKYDVSHYTTVVPIPAAAWLLGSGLVGLVVIRRRIKK